MRGLQAQGFPNALVGLRYPFPSAVAFPATATAIRSIDQVVAVVGVALRAFGSCPFVMPLPHGVLAGRDCL